MRHLRGEDELSRTLVKKYRALVSKIDEDGEISILVLEMIEDNQDLKNPLETWKTEDGHFYTMFPHYLNFDVKVGDELLLEAYRQEGETKQEWEGRILSEDRWLASTFEDIKAARKRLAKMKSDLRQLWRKRRQELRRV